MSKNKPDLITISLGAGLQSSTIVEMVVEGDLPRVDVAIFADTGDEPEYVYRQVEYLRGRLLHRDIPLDVVQKSNMVEDLYGGGHFAALPLYTALQSTRKAFGKEAVFYKPTRMKRQCTGKYKIEPIQSRIRQYLLERGLAISTKTGPRVIRNMAAVESWLGITLDEAERMKKPRGISWITHRWPLIDMRMTRQDCTLWLKERNLPIPERSSCRRCPFHSNAHWRNMRDKYPDDWAEMIQFDEDLRGGVLKLAATAKGELFLHRSCIPLSEVDFDKQHDQLSLSFCDEGYCWT